jgi:hypothetical protein
MSQIESQALISRNFSRLSPRAGGVAAERIIFLDFMPVRMLDEREISIFP